MITITGAAGFIGSNLVHALNKAGRTDILCVDDLTDGRKCANLGGAQFLDLRHWKTMGAKDYGSAGDVVVHLGANSSTQQSDGEEALFANYHATTALYERILTGVKFIYASSASVYGVHGQRAEDFSEIPENERPVSPYAFSKWMLDKYMRREMQVARRMRNNPSIGLRFFNVYGPGEQHKGEMASFAHKLISQYQATGGPATCSFVGGREWSRLGRRNFVYIDDVVKVIMWAINNDVTPGIYNVGSAKSHSFVDVADIVGSFARINNLGPLQGGPDKALPVAYQRLTFAPLDRLRAAGYTDEFLTLEEGLLEFWNTMLPSRRCEKT